MNVFLIVWACGLFLISRRLIEVLVQPATGLESGEGGREDRVGKRIGVRVRRSGGQEETDGAGVVQAQRGRANWLSGEHGR